MSNSKSQDEKDLEKLAKKLLSMPHKPREESVLGKGKAPVQSKKIAQPKKHSTKAKKRA